MSTSSKGSGLERRAMAILQSRGYGLFDRAIRVPIVKWEGGKTRIIGSHANDRFGAFDVVGTRSSDGEIYVQVTDTTSVAKRKAKVEGVVQHFKSDRNIQVWGWVGGARRRHKQTGGWTRRQYFRQFRWYFVEEKWVDVTPEQDGWIDA